jgi:hypothetical protein
MAKTPAGELLSTLKSYFNQLTDGERTPTEVAAALNDWARESAESVKAKIAEEVETTVSKMGFIKREEYDLLLARVAELESAPQRKSVTKSRKQKIKKSASKKIEKKATTKAKSKKSEAKKSEARKGAVGKVSKKRTASKVSK